MYANVADPSSGAPPADPYTKRYEYDGAGNLVYEGWAKAGVGINDPYWAIRFYTTVGGFVTLIQWANGNSGQQNKWVDRASIPYA